MHGSVIPKGFATKMCASSRQTEHGSRGILPIPLARYTEVNPGGPQCSGYSISCTHSTSYTTISSVMPHPKRRWVRTTESVSLGVLVYDARVYMTHLHLYQSRYRSVVDTPDLCPSPNWYRETMGFCELVSCLNNSPFCTIVRHPAASNPKVIGDGGSKRTPLR